MASLVIKVKYEETLRRFNVAVSDQRLDLSIEGLRFKICSLFNLPADAYFRLAYNDEDGDLVTLVDNDDLQDIVRQGLNPVRITVHVSSGQGAQSSSAPSSESAAPSTRSSQNTKPNIHPNVAEVLKVVREPLSHVLLNLKSSTQNSQQNTNPNAVKILKSVQEPLAQALSKLSLDMSSKAASTSPILADIFDGLSKMGQLYMNAAVSNSGDTNISSTKNDGIDSNYSKPNSDGRKHECDVNEGTKNDGIDSNVPVQPAPKSTPATREGVSVGPPLFPSFSFDKGKSASCESSSNNMSSSGGTKKNKDVAVQKKGVDVSDGLLGAITTGASEKESSRAFQSNCEPIPFDEFSFAGTKLVSDQICNQSRLSNRSFHRADNSGSILHKSVRCDGCGVHPITGPRFKSKVKRDFDLCSMCFSRMGNDVDYTRIDFPLAYRHPRSFNPPDAKSLCPYVRRLHVPEHPRSGFGSRFIMDVNVMDGTTMAPSTPFTKIWRMRNNGAVPWMGGLQLLWIGGDRFSSSDSVEIQVPSTGVNVASELDIAVDFIAPNLPGRYISYWRMAEPSGHKFGQPVWVQIQVDPSLDLTRESSPMLNLNFPPENTGTPFPHVANVKAEPGFGVEVGELSAPFILEQNNNTDTAGLNFPINDDLLVPAASSCVPPAAGADRPVSPAGPSSVSYPVVDAPEALFPTIYGNSNLREQVTERTEVEEIMLKELGQMGFKQTELNKEVLRKNDYDLGRSVDDLCNVSEWDPFLEELREMGFKDKETNKKLLAKNNGSITRVVMDLIAEE